MALSETQIDYVCKIGQGEAMCSFLTTTASGHQCAKANPKLSLLIAIQRQRDATSAKGDNCSGPPHFQKTQGN
ncbi:MAG: hypothetical protein Q8O87_00330 [bacterium]|nr:hypothetical protein [bacterium]